MIERRKFLMAIHSHDARAIRMNLIYTAQVGTIKNDKHACLL